MTITKDELEKTIKQALILPGDDGSWTSWNFKCQYCRAVDCPKDSFPCNVCTQKSMFSYGDNTINGLIETLAKKLDLNN